MARVRPPQDEYGPGVSAPDESPLQDYPPYPSPPKRVYAFVNPEYAYAWKSGAPRMVRVEWTDAHSIGGWHSRDELEREIAEGGWQVTTVGFLIYDDDDCIVLASQTAKNGSYDEIMRIPLGMVRAIEALST